MSQKDSPLMICHNFLISHVFPNLYGILSNVKNKIKYFGEWWQLNRMDKNAMEINETQNWVFQIQLHSPTTLLGKPVQLFDNTNR